MPAEFLLYVKPADFVKTPPKILYENADKSYIVYKRELTIYNTDSLETAKEIGVRTIIYTSIMNDLMTDRITSISLYYRFNELAGVPYGNNNILVLNGTRYDDAYTNGILKDGEYINVVNQSQSTGDYANQVGYEIYVKDSTKVFNSYTVNFPLPILTYTNAFNSVPQPSTAPLPA